MLDSLRTVLGKVTEPEFTYDIDYAASFLGWNELRRVPSQEMNGSSHPAEEAAPAGSQADSKASTPLSVLGMRQRAHRRC